MPLKYGKIAIEEAWQLPECINPLLLVPLPSQILDYAYLDWRSRIFFFLLGTVIDFGSVR